MTNHKTGYHAFVAGDRYWHRSKGGAVRRVESRENWYCRDQSQVIEAATGTLVWGRSQ